MSAIKRLTRSWCGEYRLVGDIWTGRYPKEQLKYPLSLLERTFMTLLVVVRSASLVRLKELSGKKAVRSGASEGYVVIWLVVLILLLALHAPGTPLIIAVVLYRIIDSVNYRLCILFVDRYEEDWGVRSLNRTLVLLLLNYFELIVGFAFLYRVSGAVINTSAGVTLRSADEAVYFSVVTITTLGFGDFVPSSSWVRWLVVAETLLGFVFVVLVVGAFVTGIKGIREMPPVQE